MPEPKSKPPRTAKPPVADYRHPAKRKNIPDAGLAAQGQAHETAKLQFAYDPHLSPLLRCDPTGASDALPPLLAKARKGPLSSEDTKLLAEALRNREPWLEWAGKREKKGFEVDPLALHIHERVSAQAILKIAAREDATRDLFADPQLEYQKAVQFYQHDVDWANRMILGDSLQVMASLARREDLAGKVQMIYVDPPYGIRFASNFQPQIGTRDVKDKEGDLTREPEMVKAYRDTWTLGVHSYLAYLRDRLWLCKEMLTDSGSIFMQISDENLHRVRSVLDEVFGADNFCGILTVKKTSAPTDKLVPTIADFLLWYARDRERVKYQQLYVEKGVGEIGGSQYTWFETLDGFEGRLTKEQRNRDAAIPTDVKVFAASDASSSHEYSLGKEAFEFSGRSFTPGRRFWTTSPQGMGRLAQANRLVVSGNTLFYKRYLDDFPVFPMANIWTDTSSSFGERIYVVQTNAKIIERCVLMTTEPGDLVLDPTCGSGTTAFVAEHWGRRWITVDTSRVSLALARQRLLTATYDFFKLRDEARGPLGSFSYSKIPHITLKSIAQNSALDSIVARHQSVLDTKLAALNAALKKVTAETRQRLTRKLMQKEKEQGKKGITDADRRRWLLPRGECKDWEVPFDTDPDWPKQLQDALTEYRAAWRAKMDEVNAAISANAEQEELVDQPETVRGIVRVSGPFTVEVVMPAEESLTEASPIGGEPEELEAFGKPEGEQRKTERVEPEPQNAEAYLEKMLRLLKSDGVRFPNNKVSKFSQLEPCHGDWLHAEGEWAADNGKLRKAAVSIGPQYGPVTGYQVENALHAASKRGFDDLVFAGFSFDDTAQLTIQNDPNPRVRCHLAHIRPDVNMGGLLKDTPSSQIFTVFGSPRTELKPTKDGEFVIEMEGVDIYDPVNNRLLPTSADKVAAWFLDTDYDGRTFCITQAFFPDKSAWEKLARALKAVIDEERFAALSGTTSLPFPAGKHQRAAVKVIDPRGNEVLRVHRLSGKSDY